MIFKNINSKNFSDIHRGKATILFYLPGCIHCIMMRNEWEKMKASLKKEKRNCNIYEVDGNELHSHDTDYKNHIEGFPTIVNVDNGNIVSKYEGERSENGFKSFALQNENEMIILKMPKHNKRNKLPAKTNKRKQLMKPKPKRKQRITRKNKPKRVTKNQKGKK